MRSRANLTRLSSLKGCKHKKFKYIYSTMKTEDTELLGRELN